MTQDGAFEFTQWKEDEVVHFLKENYGLDIEKVHKCSLGWENTTFKVTSTKEKQDLMFRISEDNSRKDFNFIQFEVKCLDFLSKYNLPTSKIIKTLDQKLTGIAKGKVCMISTCLNGRHYQIEERTSFSEEKRSSFTSEIANFLGQIHKYTNSKEFDIECPNERKVNGLLSMIKECKNRIEKMDKLYHQIQLKERMEKIWDTKKLYENFEELEEKLPQGLVHVDLHDTNSLFLEENQNIVLSGALDWDDSYHGIILYDVAISIIYWCGEVTNQIQYLVNNHKIKNYHLNPKLIKIYLENYQNSRGFKLTFEEKKCLKAYIVYAITTQMAFLILNLNDYKGDFRFEVGNEMLCYGEDLLKLKWEELLNE